MIVQLDHIVIGVASLDNAIENYRALGFHVIPGGSHTLDHPTYNALISLADGVYLELLAFRRPDPKHIWWDRRGLIDWACLPSDIELDVQTINKMSSAESGLYQSPVPGGRKTTTGVDVKWKISRPVSAELPFFCYDVTARPVRVPSAPEEVEHKNGAISARQVTILVRDFDTSRTKYGCVIGKQPEVIYMNDGSRKAVFTAGSHKTEIVLMAPGRDNTALLSYIEEHGEVPHELILGSSASTTVQVLDPKLTGGARILIVPDAKV
ncbi:hypothetical protein HDU93_002479 [Gonapodya sp. JEL0774]|nr:hypothetical protein HDU93_002479 [Gonapodya sp. JEL0774]